MQVHAREDSRFALLPVMQPAEIRKWVIYDVETGEILDTAKFTNLIQAKEWLRENYPE